MSLRVWIWSLEFWKGKKRTKSTKFPPTSTHMLCCMCCVVPHVMNVCACPWPLGPIALKTVTRQNMAGQGKLSIISGLESRRAKTQSCSRHAHKCPTLSKSPHHSKVAPSARKQPLTLKLFGDISTLSHRGCFIFLKSEHWFTEITFKMTWIMKAC